MYNPAAMIWSERKCQGENTRLCPPPLDSKVHGANMGPIWVLSAQDWPHEPCYQGHDCVVVCLDELRTKSSLRIHRMHLTIFIIITSIRNTVSIYQRYQPCIIIPVYHTLLEVPITRFMFSEEHHEYQQYIRHKTVSRWSRWITTGIPCIFQTGCMETITKVILNECSFQLKADTISQWTGTPNESCVIAHIGIKWHSVAAILITCFISFISPWTKKVLIGPVGDNYKNIFWNEYIWI